MTRTQPSGRRLGVPLTLLMVLVPGGLRAQRKEPSHVERFANPETGFRLAEEEATARLRQNPLDSKALLERGTARLHLGQFAAALEDLRRAAALNPASADAEAQLANGLWMSGSLDQAVIAAREALRRNPDLASAQHYLGRLLLLTGGDFQESTQHLKRAVELSPDRPEFRFDLLNGYRAVDDRVDAWAELRILRASLPPNDARPLYAEALLASDVGHLSTAIDLFRRAVATDPKLADARRDLGIALVKAARWQEAVEVLDLLAKQHPESFEVAYFHALALRNARHGPEAEQEVRRALSINPNSADAYTLLGIVLATREEHPYGISGEAISALESAVRLNPKSFDAQFYLARARYLRRDLRAALNAARATVELRPTDLEALFLLASVLDELGANEDAALAQYRELIARNPQDPRAYAGLGNILTNRQQFEDATAALRRARELDPNNFDATFYMARLLLQQGQRKQAIALFREAIQFDPRSAKAHYQLATALTRDGQSKEAKEEFAIFDRLERERRTAEGMAEPDH